MRAVFLFVFAFGFGVLVRDVAQDYQKPVETAECKANRENAERFGRLLARVLNGDGLEVDETTVRCRVRHNVGTKS